MEQFKMKQTLVDFPETTLKYMYDNYGHHNHTVKYIEKVYHSMWTFLKSNVKGPVVLGSFKTLNEYVNLMVVQGWNIDGSCCYERMGRINTILVYCFRNRRF
jgi:hypothetical protein